MSVWNDERVERLRALWSDGLSATQIAGRLGGVTRNACLGKLFRLGMLCSRNTHPLYKRPRCSAPRPKVAERRARAARATSPLQVLLRDPFIPQPEPVIPPHERQPILIRKDDGCLHANDALTPESCRWPCGDVGDADFGFCGREKVKGLPYCGSHARIAFNATNPNPQQRKLRLIVNTERAKVSA